MLEKVAWLRFPFLCFLPVFFFFFFSSAAAWARDLGIVIDATETASNALKGDDARKSNDYQYSARVDPWKMVWDTHP